MNDEPERKRRRRRKRKRKKTAYLHDDFRKSKNVNGPYENKSKVFKNDSKETNQKLKKENKTLILDFKKETDSKKADKEAIIEKEIDSEIVNEEATVEEETGSEIIYEVTIVEIEPETTSEIVNEEVIIEKEINEYTKLINDIIEPQNITDDNNLKDNNILLISEVQNKVFLPFKVSKLNEILDSKDNSYNDIEQIINEKYIVPLDNYKNKSISRYREAFILMKEKEKASLMDSIDLALEMMNNVYLNPAVITACENLDQLDVYLDCLETNELDDFPFFKIEFELNE